MKKIIIITLILFVGILSNKDLIASSSQEKTGSKESAMLATKKPFGPLADFGLAHVKKDQRPKSDWLESQRLSYSEPLKRNSYDILVVPFQVQAYAIDRVGRSLMTRYLSHRIEKSTNYKIPNPTLVARALGENQRTFNDDEVYRLANDLKIKILIRGYVGHNRDEKMRLTLLVQEKDDNEFFNSNTKVTILHWQDIPFSDERLPEDAFQEVLGEIMSKLPLTKRKVPDVIVEKEQSLLIPETILTMVRKKPASPVISSYYLQFLGLLMPEQTTACEHLFERSLVALSNVSPKSPDYPLLKARANYYLYRRPAALSMLGKPTNPEEKAFLGLLNGNLPELEKWTEEIKSPILKLMSQIELYVLRSSYGYLIDEEKIKSIAKKYPDWEMIISRNLNFDPWFVQSNLEVKQKFEEAFPIPGFTARDLAMSRRAIGADPLVGEDIDFSVYNHFQKVLKKNEGQKYSDLNGSWYPVELDYLDLLNEIGESNLLEKVRLRLFTQALPYVALQILDGYEPIYRDHPEMTYLRADALWEIAQKKQGAVRKSLEKKSKEQYYNVYYWSQEQTGISYESSRMLSKGLSFPIPNNFLIYVADYPRRWYYFDGRDREALKTSYLSDILINMSDEDKKVFEGKVISLMYTVHDFNVLVWSYNQLMLFKEIHQNEKGKTDWTKLAATLLEQNQHRFVGHPSRVSFLSKHKKEDRKKSYKDAIAANPNLWKSYLDLGREYIKEGNFKNALATFQSHPYLSGKDKIDSVLMSNYAYQSGSALYYAGAIDEAQSLLKLAVDSNTGSGAEMSSAALLAILDRDYIGSAYYNLQEFKRYNDKFGYRDYLEFLHLMGYHKEAWASFKFINIETYSPEVWTAALIGLRMEQWNDEALARFLSQENILDADNIGKESFLLMVHLIDRDSVGNITKIINDTKWKETPKVLAVAEKTKNQLIDFANGYIAIKKGEFNRAYEIFVRQNFFKNHLYLNECLLPYIVWAGIKSGKFTEFDKSLQHNSENDDGFDVHLSHALIFGHKGNHREAIRHLQLSSYRIPVTYLRPFPGRYQLLEVCELLYKDTGYKEYRDLALRWAKLYQRILPMYSWAYAVEAKYTDSASDRLRALAITLYLDKKSERILNFSESDKKKATEWLEKNNPFLKEVENKRSILGI